VDGAKVRGGELDVPWCRWLHKGMLERKGGLQQATARKEGVGNGKERGMRQRRGRVLEKGKEEGGRDLGVDWSLWHWRGEEEDARAIPCLSERTHSRPNFGEQLDRREQLDPFASASRLGSRCPPVHSDTKGHPRCVCVGSLKMP
jgi:hypothetical protein